MKLSSYESYAKWLSYNYPYYGSGADEEDVFQIAMISAWENVGKNPNSDKRFIFRTMRLRVIDFVRVRKSDKQKYFDRKLDTFNFDIVGDDVTLNSVLIKDELQRAVKAVNGLPKKQKRYLKMNFSGVPRNMIEPNRKIQTIDVTISQARKRVEAALAGAV